MNRTRDELKARRMAEVEKAIEKVLAEKTAPDKITLSEMERLAVGSGEAFKAEVLKGLTAQGSATQDLQEQQCPPCGTRLQGRGRRKRIVVTAAGSSTLERTYYRYASCGKALFPLDSAWGLDESVYSPALKRQMTW